MTEKDDRERDSDDSKLLDGDISRRGVAASILGLGGATLLTSGARGHSSRSRRWQQDVDAQGHHLYNLGELELQDSPGVIRDLAGQNLTIDDGVLHSESSSAWEDTDSDGLLEAPDSDGIDVETAKAERISQSVGENKGTERVLLDSYEDNDDSTKFDFEIDELPDYDIYELKYIVWNIGDGGLRRPNLNMQIQGDSSGGYETKFNDGSDQASPNWWVIANLGGTTVTHGKVTIRGGSPPNDGPARYVYANFEGGGGQYENNPNPVDGVYKNRIKSVNQLRIFSRVNVVGKLALWGENLAI